MNLEAILSTIRSQGGRITKVRKAILEVFIQRGCLVSENDIISYLEQKELTPNPSTIFRELQFLLEKDIIQKNTIAKVHHYELISGHKHYHFICSQCNDVTALHLHNPLVKTMQELEKSYQFNIQQHNIEFKGICKSCL